jgi:hypothetical protein
MNFRHGTNRADRSQEPVVGCRSNTAETASADDAKALTADHYREWRRWIVETIIHATYGVVPVDHLVDEIRKHEPDDIDRSTVRTGLTETILPELDDAGVLSYDADRELLINYRS